MKKIIVRGARSLCGKINVQGSKNAALPIIFATISSGAKYTLKNVPDITDVLVAIEILTHLGASVTRCGSELFIDTTNLSYKAPPQSLVGRIRASTYLIGACLARFGRCDILDFGGCNFCKRPIDLHIDAARTLGAELCGGTLIASRLVGSKIYLKKASVGATINATVMASCASGTTEIYGYAREPHVRALIDFMRACGALIDDSEECLKISARPLCDGCFTVIPDMIEAGTYLMMSVIDGGRVRVGCEVAPSLLSLITVLADSGIRVFADERDIYIDGTPDRYFRVKTAPYPGYPTDLQPQISPLMAAFCGGEIEEGVFEDRFSYLSELSKFGIKYSISKNLATVYPSEIRCASVSAPDLRGGAACLIAALMAKGQSEILAADNILRGYSNLKENLTALGADIDIV